MNADEYPSYEGALRAGGANVLTFQQFGSYQGEWYAKVEFDGRTGWVRGSYGSCSGCDAIEADFDTYSMRCETHKYSYRDHPQCAECDKARASFDERFAAFGRSYLDDILTQEEMEKEATPRYDWDNESKEAFAWLKANAITGAVP